MSFKRLMQRAGIDDGMARKKDGKLGRNVSRSTRPLELGPKTFELMRESFVQQRRNDEQETEKAPFLVVRKVRDAILDETFKPGDRLPEAELAEMFEVSRSPVREALLALEKEGTVMMDFQQGCAPSSIHNF
jgi:Bacterial regulatory proteins, gntR family